MHAAVLKSLVVVVVVAAALVPRSEAESVPEVPSPEVPVLPEDLLDDAAVQLA